MYWKFCFQKEWHEETVFLRPSTYKLTLILVILEQFLTQHENFIFTN